MEPVRTCVGCRQRATRSNLIRIVNQKAGTADLKIDRAAVMPGRGAWMHPASECLKLAIERRAFVRALKLGSQPQGASLNSFLEQAENMLASNE
jgi:predicted RNA-binding protein YlxR (DUF448 family)